MAKILSMDAYVSQVSNHENILSLGKWNFGVCIDTGISTASTSQIPDKDFNFFVDLVDDIISFGGALATVGTATQETNVETLARYVPLVHSIVIPDAYKSSEYELKLVNSIGQFAVRNLASVSSARMFNLYNADGTSLSRSSIALSGQTFDVDNSGISWGGMVVSNFAEDGSFTTNATYYAIGVQYNRYWKREKATSYYNAQAINFLNNIASFVPPSTDPYDEGGISEPGGGTGTFSDTGDTIGIPSLPTLSAVDAGFVTLFNPGIAGLRSLASYMWSDSFNLDTFKKIVANPMDCILGLSIVPVDPPNAGSKEVKVGNISTDVSLPYISTQYVEVDCGTLEVKEFWGSYLDYSPYTKLSLYLPYIGIVPIDIDDVMNASIHVVYHIDVLSGAMVAYVLCNGTQLYTYIGQCSANIPITSNDYTNTINGILGIAGNIGSLVASGGASAPSDVPSMVGNAINALKPNVQKSGAMSGTGGMLGVQTPYLILQRPKQSVAGRQNTFTGYPSNITATLSDLSGYTEVDNIHIENVPCSDDELDEIRNLLDGGVII